MARDLIDLYEPLAAEKNLTLSSPTNQGVVITGDRDMLFQAFSNLIDNAIKYAPSESHVVLDTDPGPKPFFEISDQGPAFRKPNTKGSFSASIDWIKVARLRATDSVRAWCEP